MQTIEIYTPNRDASGKFVGIDHEAIFYDPEALVEPVRITQNWDEGPRLNDGDPYPYHRLRAAELSGRRLHDAGAAGTTFQYTVPDIYGRPWAQTWEKYHEKGMERPKSEGPLRPVMENRVSKSLHSLRCGGGRGGHADAGARASFVCDVRSGHDLCVHGRRRERLNPDSNHLQIFFSPLNDAREEVLRDAKGEPVTWAVEMDSAGQAAKYGVTGQQLSARHGVQRRTAPAAQRLARGRPRQERTVPVPGRRRAAARQALRYGRPARTATAKALCRRLVRRYPRRRCADGRSGRHGSAAVSRRVRGSSASPSKISAMPMLSTTLGRSPSCTQAASTPTIGTINELRLLIVVGSRCKTYCQSSVRSPCRRRC